MRLGLKYVLTTFLIVLCGYAFATHNRAGEIVYRHLSGFNYEVTIITYTKISAPADRDSLPIQWGDGSPTEFLERTSEDDISFGNRDIRVNKYVGVHTFPGAGKFTISTEDPNRNNGILNLEPPPEQGGQSDQVVFYIQSVLTINPFADPVFGAHNESVQLLNPPVDIGCLGQPYRHNPAAFDPDGDSLSYKLVPNRIENGIEAPYYKFPQEISPGVNNVATLDPYTGDFLWESPQVAGQYNIAILVEEWRNGSLIGTVLRDMQIDILICDNIPPDILAINDTCIDAGTNLKIQVETDDLNDPFVDILGVGFPFEHPISPANFTQTNTSVIAKGEMEWQTTCAHIQKQDYNVVFKAEDRNSRPLTDFESVNIKVVGPAVENLNIDNSSGNIIVNWDANFCQNATGYKVYRRKGLSGYIPDACQTGLPTSAGYTKIADLTGHTTTTFEDNAALAGVEYCYIIVSCFPDGALGYASAEICSELALDIPTLTKVSVGITDIANGQDTIEWIHPTNLDPVIFPGPYSYILKNGDAFNTVTNTVFTSNTEAVLTDLPNRFIHSAINTEENEQFYELELFSNGNTVGKTAIGGSVYLNVIPDDRLNHLSWSEQVPWINNSYDIFRLNDVSGIFELIGTTNQQLYNDSNLTNGEEYCYFITSSGAYITAGIPQPLINYSQQSCATPEDFTPPCPPTLSADAFCENEQTQVSWLDTNQFCSSDAVKYDLLYKPTLEGAFQVLASFDSLTTNYIFSGENTIAGCFAMVVTDDNGNESDTTNIVCVDNCPDYELPNVFTPNNDGVNDVFKPFPFSYVASIDLKIFNRWGKLVFETTDPNINWAGNYRNTNNKVGDGVYFYIVKVNKIGLNGITTEELNGNVTIVGSK